MPLPHGRRHRLRRVQPADAARLREYLLKGGFLWTDDHWGPEEWEVWKRELAKVLPPTEYPIEEITPADPIFRSQFVVPEMLQIPNMGTGGRVAATRRSRGLTARCRTSTPSATITAASCWR